jgi:hypothetical protein
MARLADYGTPLSDLPVQNLEDVEGQELTLTDAHLVEGKYGTYTFITANNAEGEVFQIMTGGSFVVEAIKKVIEAKAFPVEVTFVKKGRAWLFQ